MENIKEFVKSTKSVSRVFLVIWLAMCALITLFFGQKISNGIIVADVVILIACYLLFSAMFLIPAITITQAQRARARKADFCYSYTS